MALGYAFSRDVEDDVPECRFFGSICAGSGRKAQEKERGALLLGASVGIVAGFFIGKAIIADRWVGVGIQELSFAVDRSPSTTGVSVGFAVRPGW